MRGDTHSFVIRIWYETTDEEGTATAWRGYIDHVGVDERLYFQELEKMAQFIKKQANLKPKQPRRWWEVALAWLRKP